MNKIHYCICLLLIFLLISLILVIPVYAEENSSDTWEVGEVSDSGLLNDGFEPDVVKKLKRMVLHPLLYHIMIQEPQIQKLL